MTASLACLISFASIAQAQLSIIHQEGFNDDGVAAGRYSMGGRGQLIGGDGPGAWEHSFLVDAIGLPSKAVADRAAILWTDNATEDDFTPASLAIWDNLFDFMLDGKEGATIGFVPAASSPTAEFLGFRLEEAGHSFIEISAELPDPSEVDLIIHTSLGLPPSPTDFIDYPAPVITYHAMNHDDTGVASIGQTTSGGPSTISIVEANKDHPLLAGVTGPSVPWIDDFIADEPLEGIGGALPAGATTLATYVDPDSSLVLPALLLVEEGNDLLGAFAPVPEGAGYIIGGDLNLDFEQGDGAGSGANPVSLSIDGIDLSGQAGVKLSVDLAATTVDFEPDDFLRIAYATEEDAFPEDFVVLGEFTGLDDSSSANNKSLVDPELGPLNANEFTTFTFDIPDDVDDLFLRFEAFSTFPNEVMGIDNVVVFTGEAGDPLDCNGDGVVDGSDVACATADTIADTLAGAGFLAGDLDVNGKVEFADFLILSGNFGDDSTGGVYANGDVDLNGKVEFADFLTFSDNFGKAVAASSVPEPSTFGMFSMALLMLAGIRQRTR